MRLSDFLDHFSDVEEEADGYLVHCPAHDDSKPSLRVALSDSNNILLKCRAGCHTEDVLDRLGLRFSDLSGVEAGSISARRATSRNAQPSVTDTAALAAFLLRASETVTAEGYDYLNRRFGLSRADVERLGIGEDDGTIEGFYLYSNGNRSVRRVTVPFVSFQGSIGGFQARAIEGNPKAKWSGPSNPPGASWLKYGFLAGGHGWNEVLVTEGPGDGLTACAVGYDAVLIRGASLANNSALLDELAEGLAGRVVVVAGDNDRSGKDFNERIAAGLTERGITVRVLDIPESVGDLSDWRESLADEFPTALVNRVAAAPDYGTPASVSVTVDHLFSDVGNAESLLAFIREGMDDVRYTPEGGFYYFDHAAGVWTQDHLERVRTMAQSVAPRIKSRVERFIAGVSDPKAQEALEKRLAGWVRYTKSTRGIDAMVRELKALRGVAMSLDDFDRHPDLLAVANGVVDLRTGELQPHAKELLLTRRLDVAYNPDARADRWERFLNEVFPSHPELPAYMRRLVGYGLTGHTSEQCFAVLWGTGANGKSVFSDTLFSVFGSVTEVTPFATFEKKPSGGIPNDVAALKGARLVMASEGESSAEMAASVLKRLSGQDLVTARFLRREFFTFKPTFLIFMATNFKPFFRDQDEGLWRRVKMIPFTRFFQPHERDHYLAHRLQRDESDGILAWAVRGAVEWHRDGLKDPAAIRQSTDDYRQESDALNGFVPGVYAKDTEGETKTSDVWRSYQEWCDEEGLPGKERWTKRTLFRALDERGYYRKHTSRGDVFVGFRRARKSEGQRDNAAPLADGPTKTPANLKAPDLDAV